MTAPHMDPPAGEQALRHRLKVAGAVALTVALVTTAAGIGLRLHEGRDVARWTDEQAVPTVTVVGVRQAAAAREVVLPGTVRAYIDAPIYARVNGYLRRWYVDIGARVRAGQVLAEIETPELDQQLLQAEADLATARANEQLSATTAARWQRMLGADAVSKQEADEKQGDYAAKQASVNAAKANVERLRATAAFKLIIAPFAGVVTARRTDIGALINAGAGAGQELFRVADAHKLRVYVDIPQPYAGVVRRGIVAHLQAPESPNESVTATVTDTAQSISESSRTMLVQLEADNTRGTLLPGSYVDVRFQLPERAGALRMPVSALLFRQHGLKVATVGPNDRAVLKAVTLGRDFGTDVEVTSGLGPDDRVIDNPPDSIGDGDPVRVAAAAPVPGR
jgi:RND family efflux transporter MFP subunit